MVDRLSDLHLFLPVRMLLPTSSTISCLAKRQAAPATRGTQLCAAQPKLVSVDEAAHRTDRTTVLSLQELHEWSVCQATLLQHKQMLPMRLQSSKLASNVVRCVVASETQSVI